ncbi:hypothetical protein FRC07_009862 [Ceratobasidium sp. 392]|nr:hypothetical protein FRC07_009862 [Ceratobasidium sp. 392]
MRVVTLFAFSAGLQIVAAQTIYDVWQTTWDRTKLLTRSTDPNVNFVAKGAIGDADIVVSDGTVYQQIDGFGATLTDSSALILSQLKSKNLANYNAVLAPAYLWSTLKDIVAINPRIKLYVLPWSPPAWMKSPASMNGGTLQSQYNGVFAQYLLKTVQQLKAKGFTVYAINPQNEPENPNGTYPTTSIPYSQEAAIGQALRPLLDNNGFSSVKIIGYEHNWDHAGQYPVSLMNAAGGSFAGVAFHCYGGGVANQDTFHNAFPNKEVYFTECTGTLGSDWWSDIKWYMDNM